MKHKWHTRHSRKRHTGSKKWGLRRRFTFMFAFVALAAVTLTTWLTLGAVFNAQRDLFDLQTNNQTYTSPDKTTEQSDRYSGRDNPNYDFKPFSPFRYGPDFANDPNFESAAKAFGQITRTAFLAALLSFLLASGAAAALTRFLTRPLKALTEGAQRLEAGERNIQLKVPSSQDELRSLTEAFNNMSAGLERQETWRRNMVADVAHDLRTPLAVLRSEIEAMQDGIVQTDPEGLDRLHNEVMLMAGLVGDLKTLSVAESGVFELQKERVNIRTLIEETVEAFSRKATEAKSSIVLKEIDDVYIDLDVEQMRRVLRNLIDNALLYASPCTVELSATVDDVVDFSSLGEETQDGIQGLVLAVRDTGEGMPEGVLEQVFERFYRGDSSRSKEGSKRGSGLGLSIAKAISEAHGGSIRAVNHPEGGSKFEIWLPLDVSTNS